MRTVIVGDIGGQYDLFRDVVKSVGGDPLTGVLPPDLTMIQVGDIVRFNNSPDLDSLSCALYAQKLLEVNGDRYIQLLGNHESPLLGGITDPYWAVQELPESEHVVRNWWDGRLARLGVVLRKPGQRDILVTHAGLTRGYQEWLGTSTAVDTVKALNSLVGTTSLASIEKPGKLATKGEPDLEAGVWWALVGCELNDSWRDGHPTFNQIHGHSVVVDWENGEYWSDIPEYVRDATMINYRDRYTITQYESGYWLRSVDWMLKNSYHRQEWPLLILNGYDVIH